MEQSKKPLVIICVVLGTAVVVLLIAMAFLLGRLSVKNGSDNGDAALLAEAEKEAAVTQTQADAPRNLDISMSSGNLTFVVGDSFHVEYDETVISVKTTGDTMRIETIPRHPTADERERMNVTVTTPEGCVFNDVDMEMGAGKLIVHTLKTGTLDLDLGAGSAEFEGLYATGSATIQEGAGEFTVKSGSLANLTLQCGAGEASVTAALTGNSRIDAAIGEVDLHLSGTEADYTVDISLGIGECYYNNEKLSNSGAHGTGENRVEVNGGLGVLRVNVG